MFLGHEFLRPALGRMSLRLFMDYEHLLNAMIGLSISQQDHAKSAEAICIKPGEKDQAWDLSQFGMDQVQRPE